jgi:hypothetical protein
MIVLNTKQTLLATTEIEKTGSKVERVYQMAIFLFFASFLQESSKLII